MMTWLTDRLRRNPYPMYALLRRVAPVLRVPWPGVWLLTDHDAVKQALQDQHLFSSRAAPPGGAPIDWLLFLDPPRHTRLRTLITRSFAPRAIAALEPRVASITHALLDEVIATGRMDLVNDFSRRLPVLVIMELLGVPADDAPMVARWSEAMIGLGDTIFGGERGKRAAAAYREAVAEMRLCLDALLAERRATPRDDLLTRLAEAEVDEERLGDEDILLFFQLLLVAGTETTTNLIANAVLCFLEHPDQLALARGAPDAPWILLPVAIEEVLRYRAPAQAVFRATTRDIEFRGRRIPAGALVVPVIGSATRDPKRFARPDQFDVTRERGPHLAFGHGAHFCIGAALARLEARVALTVLFDRIPDLRRVDRRLLPPAPGLNVLGPRSLPLRFTPAVPAAAATAVAVRCPVHMMR